MKNRSKVEFGDFQTPKALANEVCSLLSTLIGQPDHVVEPTAGRGAFLLAAADVFPNARLHGWEINGDYVAEAQSAMAARGRDASVAVQDFFTLEWEAVFKTLPGEILILGNPPWVTNSGVAAVNGSNLPIKENFMGLRGIAARTGKANFDISEWMLIRLLRALGPRPATLAMLCKTATARKFLRYAWRSDGRIEQAAIYRIDSQAHFGAAVDACLLFARTGAPGKCEARCFDSLSPAGPSTTIGLAGSDLIANVTAYRRLQHLEGLCPYQWRSGVKHDCSVVMELLPQGNNVYVNGLGESVALEPDFVFPLLKCSDLANSRTTPRKAVIVTQQFVGDDTSVIAQKAPLTWRYLQAHADRFAARKSSIYKSGASFALFGIGAYSFAPWKVAISGLHKSPQFQAVGPHEGKPVFFDDTCYFISCTTQDEANLVAEVLNSEPSLQFLRALIFTDSKRPITSDLLHRMDLAAIALACGNDKKWRNLAKQKQPEIGSGGQLALVMESSVSPARKSAGKRRGLPSPVAK